MPQEKDPFMLPEGKTWEDIMKQWEEMKKSSVIQPGEDYTPESASETKPIPQGDKFMNFINKLFGLFQSSSTMQPDDLRVMIDNAQQRKLNQNKVNINALEDSWK